MWLLGLCTDNQEDRQTDVTVITGVITGDVGDQGASVKIFLPITEIENVDTNVLKVIYQFF